jgi:SAM-dependent methyltransferase
MSSSPSYLDPIILPLVNGETVLDVGCGYGRWGSLLETNFFESGLKKPPQIDGLDAFQPNVDFCSRKSCYSRVWQQVMPSPLKGKWDIVLACEIIEHVDQRQLDELMDILEGAAKKRVILTTPNWPYYRDGGETLVGWNDYEAHLSYVSRDYFKKRGYKVIGAGFGNPKLRIVGLIKRFADFLTPALESLPRLLPFLGESIVVYKDM